MNSLARDVDSKAALQRRYCQSAIQTLPANVVTHYAAADQDNQHVDDGEADLSGGRKPLAPVKVQPVYTGQSVTEPTSKEGALRRTLVKESEGVIAELTIRLSRSLNTGMASAMIQAMIQQVRAMATHDPIEKRSRRCIRSVPRKRRT